MNRSDRIRTCGLYVPNVALYQTEPYSDIVAGATGFEPVTLWFVARCYCPLSYAPVIDDGWQGGIRTHNPSVNSRVLCR